MLRTGLIDGTDFDLDFHTIMHWGEDPALEKHYVAKRSQRTRSVLTFFAQDASTHNLIYANADISKATQAQRGDRVLRPLALRSPAAIPALLVFDQKLTTQAVLAELDERGCHIHDTTNAQHPRCYATSTQIDPKAWKTVRLDRDGNYRKPQVVDETVAPLRLPPHRSANSMMRGLGRDSPDGDDHQQQRPRPPSS